MHSYILLDCSGSMSSNWDETLGAINLYVKELCKNKQNEALVTLRTFEGANGLFETIPRSYIKASKWKPVTSADARPGGLTPLFDAINSLNQAVKKDKPELASVVIITDGMENASTDTSLKDVKKIIKKFKKKDYDVTFIGADFDAFQQSSIVGVSRQHTINTSAGSYDMSMTATASKHADYGATGKPRGFSMEERKRAMGKKV